MSEKKRALIVVDMQKDFMDDGALPVPGAYEIIDAVNEAIEKVDCVLATQDWHPSEHKSFASNHEGADPGDVREVEGLDQILWPDHCVQETEGAEFVEGLRKERFVKVFRKGEDWKVDSYSGFYDNARRHSTGLTAYLREREIEEVLVCGVATDYCVKFTVLDALKDGFETTLLEDATAGVELKEGDVQGALEEMKSAGAKVLRVAQVGAEERKQAAEVIPS